ncbi:uncharacterized protein LOC116349539 [Contarinia nasturtii]|uniref:uncharacterized protein LOC116349539 n=1 Tax=Contarinia nasturtii TaxID=265458 RepID=UPI0012D45FE8|nr:uncharacterized protein LOC116349539 [Contarinia nasturtii]
MDDLFKCICDFGENHYWLRCFLKQVAFFIKRVLACPVLFHSGHTQYHDDIIKIAIWKDIAYDYKGKFTQNDSSDAECEDVCTLKMAQKCAQHQVMRVVKLLNSKSMDLQRNRLDLNSVERQEVRDNELIDFLHQVAFIFECILANPVLYDRKHEHHQNERFKFKTWDEICALVYQKIQSDGFWLGDEDTRFEIKHTQKTIEHLLYRIAFPLNKSRNAAQVLKKMAADIPLSSDMEYNSDDNDSVSGQKHKRPVTINIAPSTSGSQAIKIIICNGLDPKMNESKTEHDSSSEMDTTVEENSVTVERVDGNSNWKGHASKHVVDKERSHDDHDETMKRKHSENESYHEHSPAVEPSQRKKHKSNVSSTVKAPDRFKSIIQKKDEASAALNNNNLRRK